jgi:hypothetical protein
VRYFYNVFLSSWNLLVLNIERCPTTLFGLFLTWGKEFTWFKDRFLLLYEVTCNSKPPSEIGGKAAQAIIIALATLFLALQKSIYVKNDVLVLG